MNWTKLDKPTMVAMDSVNTTSQSVGRIFDTAAKSVGTWNEVSIKKKNEEYENIKEMEVKKQ